MHEFWKARKARADGTSKLLTPTKTMAAEIRRRWKPMSRHAFRCARGRRDLRDVWLLADRMPRIVLDVIARELAKGENVQIDGVGVLYTRFGGSSTALGGFHDRVNRPIAPRRMVGVRFSRGKAPTGMRFRFKPHKRLKAMVRGEA